MQHLRRGPRWLVVSQDFVSVPLRPLSDPATQYIDMESCHVEGLFHQFDRNLELRREGLLGYLMRNGSICGGAYGFYLRECQQIIQSCR